MSSPVIDPELAKALEKEPAKEYDLLVHVDRADDETEASLRTLGLKVRYRFQLVPSFAVRGSGRAALKLLGYAWVKRVEEDRQVYAM